MLPELVALAADPSPLSREVVAGGIPFFVRALRPGDTPALTAFLAGLSPASRRFWHDTDDHAAVAAEWVSAIGRYDKLRLVAHEPAGPAALAGVIDLSFSLPEGQEITRFAAHGLALDPARTVRFGPCVADGWQGRGLAAALLPPAWHAARLLSRDQVVLYGGVHADNHRARRFYRRHGFVDVGTTGECVDMMLTLRRVEDPLSGG